jgi:small subunit ribosomal protein S20
MAHSLSAKKRARQSIKRKMYNQVVKSQIKTHVKKMRLMLAETDNKTGSASMGGEICKSYKLIDKAVSKGVIHKNKAARLKSRLTLAANKIARK